jgi:hypothetical protein
MMDSEFNAVAHFILHPIRKSAPDPAYRETFERLVRALNMPFVRMEYAEMMRRSLVALFEPAQISEPVHIRDLGVPTLGKAKRKRLKERKQLLLPPPARAAAAVRAPVKKVRKARRKAATAGL